MKQKKSLQEVLFNLLLFFFCRGTSGEELECWREEAVFKEVREREAGGELVFIIHTSSRVAGQQIADERRALLFFLLSVIPFLGLSLCSQSFSFTLPSLFASSSSFHTKLYVVIYCCAVQCSYYSHLFGFPALRLSFAPCESSCLCLRLCLWSLLPVPRQGTLILFCCLPTLYINLIFPLLPSLGSADVFFFFFFFLVLGLLRGVSSPPPFLLR